MSNMSGIKNQVNTIRRTEDILFWSALDENEAKKQLGTLILELHFEIWWGKMAFLRTETSNWAIFMRRKDMGLNFGALESCDVTLYKFCKGEWKGE